MLIVKVRLCEVNHTMVSAHSLSCSLLEIVALVLSTVDTHV